MNNVIRPTCWERHAAYLRNGDLPPVGRATSLALIVSMALAGWSAIFALLLMVMP